MKAHILNRSEAAAVYSAMCALIEGPANGIDGRCPVESYADQNEFATAYGL